jgi:hypothetical protein
MLGGKVLFLLLAVSVEALAGYDLRPVMGPAGPEVTAEFQRLVEARAHVSRSELAPYKILFVPGFTATYLDQTVGYFREARAELERLGLREGKDFELILDQRGFAGERTVSENSAALAEILRDSPRPVLVVTHSKGGVDLLEALIVHPDLRAKVRGWFSYQGAIGGSILADVVSRGWTRPIMRTFLAAYGGSIEALEDMRQDVRAAYIEEHLADVEAVVREVPVVSLVTQEDYDRLSFRLRTVVKLFDPDYLQNESDGMISIRNAMLPYSPFVFLTGVSHENTCESGDYDRAGLTEASLRYLLDRARR